MENNIEPLLIAVDLLTRLAGLTSWMRNLSSRIEMRPYTEQVKTVVLSFLTA